MPITHKAFRLVFGISFLLALNLFSACGHKLPLTLPEEEETINAPSSTTPNNEEQEE